MERVSVQVRSVMTLWERELVRFVRQRSRVIGAMGTPLIFWLLIGSGLGGSFRAAGSDGVGRGYLEYFFPGTLLLVLLFTAIFSTFSLIEDRSEGFLQGVLVSPVGRGAIVLGKVLGGTTLAWIQAMVLLPLAPAAGIPLSALSLLLASGAMALVAFALTCMGFLIAWRMDSAQGFHSLMNLLLIPMWLLSGAVFPASGSAKWLAWLMHANPLTYNLAVIRHALYFGGGDPGRLAPWALSWSVAGVFAVAMFAAAWRLAQRPTGM